MTIEELVAKLSAFHGDQRDCDETHEAADMLLLEYINSKEVTAAFLAIERWYD